MVIAINFSAGNPMVVLNGVLTAVVLSGRLTGAHLNMAVTVGVFLAEDTKKMKKNIILLIIMLLSQFVGAFFGQWIAHTDLTVENIAILKPLSTDYSAWNVFFIEAMCTFIFVSCVLHNVFPRLSIQSDTVLAVGSICVSLYFAIIVARNYTGAAINPTFAIANILFVSFVKDSTYVRYLPAYALGTLLGGILAGIICKYLVMPVVPHYYDNLLQTYREEIQTKISMLDNLEKTTTNYIPIILPPMPLIEE